MAFKKIDREFCLTDDSVNVYGYRLLTSGLKLDRFNPPIGFLMHERERGIAVRWEDFRFEEGRLYAKPVVNETSFPELAQQIEDGFYAAASVGHIVAVAMTEDFASKLEGQTGPTVTEWFPRECSIVDIPGNYNAIARLYDEADNLLHDLSDNLTMEKQEFNVAALGLPGLSAEAGIEEAASAVKSLVDRAEAAEKELEELKAAGMAARVQDLLDKGIGAGKLTRLSADILKDTYGNDPEGLQKLIDSMPAAPTIHSCLSSDLPEAYRGKSYRELYLTGELADVKVNYPEYYEQLIKQSKN